MRHGGGLSEKVEDASLKNHATPIHQAIIWVHKAKAGSVQWVDKCSEEQFNYYLLAKKMKILGHTAKYGLLLCTLFDTPSWCRGTPEPCSSYVKQMYSPNFPILSQNAGAGISLVFWAILGARMRLRKLAMGEAYSFHQWHLFTAVIITIGAISAVISLAFPLVYDLSVFCRPFAFIGCTKSLRKGFAHILVSIPGFIDVIVSLAICVFVCVWVGMIMFARTSEGYTDFFAWRQGFAQMWILFTTNNTPDVVMPAYNANRAYFWFFLIYLIITVFLLGNVLLARVYDTYKGVLTEYYKQFYQNRRDSTMKAYKLLSDGPTGVSPHMWHDFFAACCDRTLGSIEVADQDDVEANLGKFIELLKKKHGMSLEQSSGIKYEQFRGILHVIFHDDLFLHRKRMWKDTFRFEILRQLNIFFFNGYDIGNGSHITWDGIMDCIILLGTICVFWQSWNFAHTYNVYHTYMDFLSTSHYWILFCISIIYAFAISAKISSLGFWRFWKNNPWQHRFDFFNVYGLIISELLYIAIWPTIGMMRLIMLLHMARGIRLFYYIEPLQHFFLLLRNLVPVYGHMGMILFLVFWIFCDIGQIWFGGLIYTSNPNLAGTNFASPSYNFFELNFNCFLDGMITLFTLMCMNNWSDTSDGYMQATGSYMSQVYFVAFTIICNMIVLNILIALIIDCTGQLKDELEKDAELQEGDQSRISNKDSVLSKIVGGDIGAEEDAEDSSESSSEDSEEPEEYEGGARTMPLQAMSAVNVRRRLSKGGLSGPKKRQSKSDLVSHLTKEEKKSERKRYQRLVGQYGAPERKLLEHRKLSQDERRKSIA